MGETFSSALARPDEREKGMVVISSKIGFEVTIDQPYFHVPASEGTPLF
jgi:hypothetical protein